jgi:LuxR family transcriptional regulator, maltose regulon positive regulatory protein
VYANMTLAQLYQAQGEPEQAMAALRLAEGIAGQTASVSLVEEVALIRSLLLLRQGQVNVLVGEVQKQGLRLDAQRPFSSQNTTLIQLAIARSRTGDASLPDEVVAILNQRCALAAKNGLAWNSVSSLILLAMAYQVQGRAQEALETFAKALRQAQTLGFVRTFVDQGIAVRALLQAGAGRMFAPDYVAQLTAAFDVVMPADQLLPHTRSAEVQLVEPLRPRELEVLRHVAMGLSDREIAEEMILAVSTVKWHLKNTYQKLQVSRRTQALTRARELGML